ncbi:carbamoyltransferase HypF [Sphaerisporangium melleum]|uniref:Carbamoyltransferase n=1 Tax=Sphaerisporangium melleum TaxID=321316 RepID=A0A917RIW2_9ACTN|nr:carbamoyltransferase HypF [Sphaerisporangium melleum]GGL09745.1 carbamoyltransferase [Sphaerisporangium melleum]
MRSCIRAEVRVDGVVQGVGFRPFVHRLATGLGLCGLVGNDERGVFIEVEGPAGTVSAFVRAVRDSPPPLAVVDRVTSRVIPVTGEPGFGIVASAGAGNGRALISPDVATCDECLRELWDPADRRHLHPFVNCTACGPRFTIVLSSPYDRAGTTMASFPMCEECAREYHDPASRRFHAQAVCCPACGPRLRLLAPAATASPGVPSASGHERLDGPRAGALCEVPGDPVAGTVALLRAGRIVAIKGIGGYHLAASAGDERAVAGLRARKRREDRPFALMVPDLPAVRRLCVTGPEEERLLTGRSRPIVLMGRRPDAPVAPAVAPGARELGVMLPYSPLHHLLLRRLAEPIVLTSGNLSDEPIAHTDEAAFTRLSGLADAFLTHDRPIHTRADDSVVRVFRGAELPVRRSRGHVPAPLPLARGPLRPVLGCGAELKHTFCLARGRRAFVSQHIGDLENHETLRSFTEGVRHFERLFGVRPEVVAHDLHPEYLSTKYALDREDTVPVGVQHHHAHIASCLADNGAAGPVIGVAFDGLGYGTDGTLWGGEFLVAGPAWFRRAGHLAPVPLPGGAAAVRQPWRMAAAYLGDAAPAGWGVRARNAALWDAVTAMAARGVNAPPTSSAGRLFDAVSAIVTGRDAVTYEGQAAVELEQLADPAERRAHPCRLLTDGVSGALEVDGGRLPAGGETFVAMGHDLVEAALEDVRAGVAAPLVSARFHNGVAGMIAEGCDRVREGTGLATVALSGGVFQNVLLLERATALLEERGFTVLRHRRVPPNDGGISLGQVAVAAAGQGRGECDRS